MPRQRRAVVERRRAQRRHRAMVIGAAVVLAGTAGSAVWFSSGEAPRSVSRLPPTTTTTAPPRAAAPAQIATTAVGELTIYSMPDPTSTRIATLPATTGYRAPTTLLVDPDRETQAGFVPVTVPLQKPNHAPGWVNTTDVTLSETSFEIHVNLSTHTLVLKQGDTVVLQSTVIIGTAETPTPTGRFFVTDPVNCNTESVAGYPVGQCGGAYGAFAIGISGLSETLDSFDGTIPQIALHGTNLPASELGKDLSNGCIRMPNDVIVEIARIQPLLGTPVIITAD